MMGFQKLTSPAISSLADGQKALDPILQRIAKPDLDWNEAQTRFSFLDDFLTDCLSWSKDDIHVEVAQGRSYTDYELGSPRQIIWEAKKEGKTFDLPANPTMSIIEDLASIIALGGEAAEAVKQAQQYCATRGVEFAVVSNGRQFIAFLAVRFDGTPPLEGKCFVINNVEQLSAEFPTVWQHLSPSGVAERRLFRLLTVGVDESLPPKLSSFLIQYPRIRYGSPIQTSLRTISELLLADIVETDAVEPQFYKECYCESGALSNNSLVSRQILVARYAAIFKDTATQPSVSPVAPRKGEIVLTPEVVAEAIARRPIVLVGDVGVGKTAFLKHLMYISAHDEFKKAIYIYIDLGSQGALAINLKEFVLAEVEKQLSDLYQVDVYERRFIMGVYNLDIKNFDKGLYGPLKTKQPELYQEKILAFLDARITNKAEHLKRSIQHLARGRKKQVVLIIDNSDQRSYEIQQHAFLISQTLSRDWDATVFVAVRPATFYQSRQAGTLAAYTHRVLTISPPRADRVVEMRLKFALKLCEGEIPLEKLEGVRFNLSSMATFLKALIFSLQQMDDLREFLSNITGGNIRSIVELVTKFIGSPNVDAEKIIRIMEENGEYHVPVHEFWKEAMLGQYAHYHSDTSLALNIYEIMECDEKAHFLIPMILGYLNFDGAHKDRDGFVSTQELIREMQNWGFAQLQIESALRRLNNKKLTDTVQRVTFDEDVRGLYGPMPESFRLNTVGAYHLKRWIGEFAYFEAMVYDTPICDSELAEKLRIKAESFKINDRLERALEFKSYLAKAWHSSGLAPQYFDWMRFCQNGERSFMRVERAIRSGF